MTDNVQSNRPQFPGGPKFRTDLDGDVHVPVNKVQLGNEDSFDGYVSSTNPMPTGEAGIASVNNVSTTPLAGGGTFTGTAEQNPHPDVMVSCFSDTAGTLYFDFSVNGTDWRTFPVAGFAVSASIHEFHTAVKGPRYFRVRFVNGSSAQSTFQLYTYYGQFRQANAPLNQAHSLDADSILVRPTYPWLDIERGLVTGMDIVKKFGRGTIGTTYSPITGTGTYPVPQSSAATALRIKAGGSATDTLSASGAWEVTIQGLDENFNLVTEAITTNGASASSPTTTTFTRMFRAYVSKSGAYATATTGSHAATITIENAAGGTDWGELDATGFPRGQSEIGAYSVPAGYTAYVFRSTIVVATGKTADLIFFQRANIDETAPPYTAMRAVATYSALPGGVVISQTGNQLPLGPFVGPCDIGWMGKVNTTTGEITIEFEIFLVNE